MLLTNATVLTMDPANPYAGAVGVEGERIVWVGEAVTKRYLSPPLPGSTIMIPAGFMNMIGWLAGGGSAPIAIGVIAERISLGAALALASLVYVAAAALLIAGMMMVKQGDVVGSVRL